MKRNLLNKFLFAILLNLLFCAFIQAQSEEFPLTPSNIEKALRSTKVSLQERNRLLTEGVRQRGVTFNLSNEFLNKLAKLGASKKLLEAIVEKAPVPPTFLQAGMERGGNPINMMNKFDIEFLLIPKGEFMMGAKDGEIGSLANEKPKRKVKISQHFYIGKTEVTQGQWKAVMGNNPSRDKQCGNDCPVDSVSWNQVQEFIKKLNAAKGEHDGYSYRLPTEAEWEYAARAMTETIFFWGDDEGEKVWRLYAHSNDKTTVPVASYQPNGFGLYDMSGNVWELVEDVWNSDFAKLKTDGSANLTGDAKERVMKGGSFAHFIDELRPARRGKIASDAAMHNVGFRLAAVWKKP